MKHLAANTRSLPARLPYSLRRHTACEQLQWRKDRPFDLSGFEYPKSYELQQALNDTPHEQSTSCFVRDMPQYYALGQGRYWLKYIGSLMDNADRRATKSTCI